MEGGIILELWNPTKDWAEVTDKRGRQGIE